jgi:hypothetical protein
MALLIFYVYDVWKKDVDVYQCKQGNAKNQGWQSLLLKYQCPP